MVDPFIHYSNRFRIIANHCSGHVAGYGINRIPPRFCCYQFLYKKNRCLCKIFFVLLSQVNPKILIFPFVQYPQGWNNRLKIIFRMDWMSLPSFSLDVSSQGTFNAKKRKWPFIYWDMCTAFSSWVFSLNRRVSSLIWLSCDIIIMIQRN